MVESSFYNLNFVRNAVQKTDDPEVNFYEKSSGFKEIRKLKTSGDKNTNHSGTPLNYPVLLAHNKTAPLDLIIANTNQRVQILNL